MGYFRRPIRRRRCASQVAEAVARQSSAGVADWVEVPADPPRPGDKTVYLRFAVGRIDEDSRQQLGVFHAARELKEEYGLESDVARMLRPVQNWFNEYLFAPHVAPSAIFWFKSGATP